MTLTKTQLNSKQISNLACKYKKDLKRNSTPAEKHFKKILKKYNICFKFQGIIYTPKNFYLTDFLIFNKPKTIIEVDGNYHKDLKQVGYDNWRSREIKKTRYKEFRIVRITNKEVFNGKAEQKIINLFPRQYRKYFKNE